MSFRDQDEFITIPSFNDYLFNLSLLRMWFSCYNPLSQKNSPTYISTLNDTNRKLGAVILLILLGTDKYRYG